MKYHNSENSQFALKLRISEIINSNCSDELVEMFHYAIHQDERNIWGSQSRGRLFLNLSDDSQDALDAACAIEIWHNVTLLIDDVIDDSLERRKGESFWRKYSKDTAFTMAFYMDRIATKILYDKNLFPIVQLFNKCSLNMALAETKTRKKLVTFEDYLSSVISKTANFYVMTYEAASSLNQKTPDQDITDAIRIAGILHQYNDDISDITSPNDSFHHRAQEESSSWLYLPEHEKDKLNTWINDSKFKISNLVSQSSNHELNDIIREIAYGNPPSS